MQNYNYSKYYKYTRLICSLLKSQQCQTLSFLSLLFVFSSVQVQVKSLPVQIQSAEGKCKGMTFFYIQQNRSSFFDILVQQSSVWTFAFQLKAKRSECNSKATHSRNDYLLTLAAANAHQQRYYDTDLTDCIKVRIQYTL